MKLMSLIFLMALTSIGQAFSQEQPDKVIAYKAWVSTINDSELKGLLFYANENEIVITNGFKSNKKELIHIPYQNVETIKLQRRGLKTKGAILGIALGVGLALLLTKNVEDSSSFIFGNISRETIVLGYVVDFAIAGGVVGAKMADDETQFYINGNEYAFKNQIDKLKGYCLVREQPESVIDKQ